MTNLRQALEAPAAFWEIDREERNAVARLLVLLAEPTNLRAFVGLCGWDVGDLADAEVGVEWTYARDLWAKASGPGSDQERLRGAIIATLQPSRADLATCEPLEFNSYFGAVPSPSATYIQSPSNWSVSRFDANIPDNAEFLKTCRYKWAFNIKPDLVVQLGEKVLCVEAKWDSEEGTYPSSEGEKAIFNRRGLDYVKQTDVQRYLVNELLGFDGHFVYLSRAAAVSHADASVTWAQLRDALDASNAPSHIRLWWNSRSGV